MPQRHLPHQRGRNGEELQPPVALQDPRQHIEPRARMRRSPAQSESELRDRHIQEIAPRPSPLAPRYLDSQHSLATGGSRSASQARHPWHRLPLPWQRRRTSPGECARHSSRSASAGPASPLCHQPSPPTVRPAPSKSASAADQSTVPHFATPADQPAPATRTPRPPQQRLHSVCVPDIPLRKHPFLERAACR